MKIVVFDELDKNFTKGYEVASVDNSDHDANVAILDINTIFDYEDKKLDVSTDGFKSIAIIDDPSDFDAFKNFGITAWIKRDSLEQLPKLLDEIQTRISA